MKPHYVPSSTHRAGRLALLASALLLAGCCGHPCFDESNLPGSKSLTTPYDTVDYVRFCTRHELWDPLYDALSKHSRRVLFEDADGEEAMFSRFEFSVVFPRVTYGRINEEAPEALKDVRVVDVVHGGSIRYVGEAYNPWTGDLYDSDHIRQITLHYETPENPPAVVPEDLTVFLIINEGTADQPRWTLGVMETIEWLQKLDEVRG